MKRVTSISLTVCWIILIVSGLSVLSFADTESETNTKTEQHLKKANELLKRMDYEAAIDEYNKVVTMSSNSKITQDAQYWIGQSYFRAGQFDAALSVFQKLINEYPASKTIPTTKLMIERVQLAKKTESLFEATIKGDIEQVKKLISEGIDINAEDKKENTSLGYAVETGKMELVQLLVEAGADVNAGSWSPLYWAVDHDKVAIAKYLLAQGAKIDDGSRWTALQEASDAGSVEMVELLIANGADVNAGGWTALQTAVHEGRKEIVDVLIQNGAKTNVMFRGKTILHVAAACCNKQMNSPSYGPGVVEVLLAHGLDINVRDNRGSTPLHNVSDFLCNNNNDKLKEVAELLVAKGADVDSKDNDGQTPLFFIGEKDIAKLLIDRGANINIRDNRGRTALHAAAERGQKEVAELLITKGANIDAEDADGHTPLSIAVHYDLKIAGLLISKGADGNIKTESGKTLLQLAKERESIELTVPDKIFKGESNSLFGNAIACGDVDGDGYDDVLLGAGRYDNGRGRAYLFYGGPDMDTTCDLVLEGEGLRGTDESWFGSTVSCGDIDNDGYDDLVVGAYRYDQYRGRAYLYWGSERGSIDAKPDKLFDGEAEKETDFSAIIEICDIDNDGYSDIIIGAPKYRGKFTGRAYLYYGNTKELMDTSYDLVFTGEKPRDYFGIGIGHGDVDNDGYEDIIIGATGYRRGGRAYLYFGDKRDNMDTRSDQIFSAESAGSRFGRGITCVDQNRDGCDDILIGAATYKGAQGRVYLFNGNARPTLDNVPDKTFDEPPGQSFYGSKIITGDIDGDKRTDIIVEARLFRRQARIYVYWGNELSTEDMKLGRIFTGERSEDFVTTGLACGDINNDGYDDLFIEAPAFKADSEYGRVYLFYGGPRNK